MYLVTFCRIQYYWQFLNPGSQGPPLLFSNYSVSVLPNCWLPGSGVLSQAEAGRHHLRSAWTGGRQSKLGMEIDPWREVTGDQCTT